MPLSPCPVREQVTGKKWRGEKGGGPLWMGADPPKSCSITLMRGNEAQHMLSSLLRCVSASLWLYSSCSIDHIAISCWKPPADGERASVLQRHSTHWMMDPHFQRESGNPIQWNPKHQEDLDLYFLVKVLVLGVFFPACGRIFKLCLVEEELRQIYGLFKVGPKRTKQIIEIASTALPVCQYSEIKYNAM